MIGKTFISIRLVGEYKRHDYKVVVILPKFCFESEVFSTYDKAKEHEDEILKFIEYLNNNYDTEMTKTECVECGKAVLDKRVWCDSCYHTLYTQLDKEITD